MLNYIVRQGCWCTAPALARVLGVEQEACCLQGQCLAMSNGNVASKGCCCPLLFVMAPDSKVTTADFGGKTASFRFRDTHIHVRRPCVPYGAQELKPDV